MEEITDKLVLIVGSPKSTFVKDGILHKIIYANTLDNKYQVKVGAKVGVGVYELALPDTGEFCGYHIVVFRCRLNRFENDLPYYGLPSNESWGTDGFSKYTWEGAMIKVRELENMLSL